ncbi:hypothetical protein [Leptobacterium sp. I13]|uniref:hypothetical protein n=1 Tax=Leptobacterium meishanense TaxID=3128904 RepID=UPI0030EB52EB
MKKEFIELKVNRDFGEIIAVYFDFFKQNIKKFTNIFISYNGIFLIVFLIISYLLISGFLGLITEGEEFFQGTNLTSDDYYLAYLILGGALFFITFIIVAIMNYSLASSYMIHYEKNKGAHFTKQDLWKLINKRLGSILGFILLIIAIYVVVMIISVVLAFIPIIGMFIQYIMSFSLSAWIGVSFMCMLYQGKGVTDALGEGWKLVMGNFWKSVGVNFILGLLVGLLVLFALSIPGIIIGIYTFHVVDTDLVVGESVFAKVVYSLGLSCVLIITAYSQSLSQFINGILFFNLHEKEYNTNAQEKIQQIGADSE